MFIFRNIPPYVVRYGFQFFLLHILLFPSYHILFSPIVSYQLLSYNVLSRQ
jgi:hypothetical protein